MSKTSEIIFTVQLDEKNVPSKIEWMATDAGFPKKKECKSIMISLWDKVENATMGIDLWTKEMNVDEMNIHIHQTLIKLSDTLLRSTKNNEAAKMVEDFSAEFAEKLGLEKKVKKDFK